MYNSLINSFIVYTEFILLFSIMLNHWYCVTYPFVNV